MVTAICFLLGTFTGVSGLRKSVDTLINDTGTAGWGTRRSSGAWRLRAGRTRNRSWQGMWAIHARLSGNEYDGRTSWRSKGTCSLIQRTRPQVQAQRHNQAGLAGGSRFLPAEAPGTGASFVMRLSQIRRRPDVSALPANASKHSGGLQFDARV